MSMRHVSLFATLAAAATVFATIAPAEALQRNRGTIVACSWYGNQCVTAPVRRGKLGPEVRTKGGTWIDCRGDCRETLREETLDFWETQDRKAKVW